MVGVDQQDIVVPRTVELLHFPSLFLAGECHA
jgi:hypothetical protein